MRRRLPRHGSTKTSADDTNTHLDKNIYSLKCFFVWGVFRCWDKFEVQLVSFVSDYIRLFVQP